MAAYIIVDVSIMNYDEYEEYKKLTPDSLKEFKGEFIVRGGKVDILEGNWEPGRIVVLKFPTKELGNQWWSSDIYSKAKIIRQRAAKTKMLLVDGVD